MREALARLGQGSLKALSHGDHRETGILDRLLNALNAVGAVWIFALMALVCAEIVSRFAFNAPIRGVAEIAGFSVVVITFLQLPLVVRRRLLARADVLIERVAAGAPRAARSLETAFSALGAAVFATILWASATGLVQAWRTDDRFGAQGTFTLPKWWLWAVILVGSACAVVTFLVEAWRLVRGRPAGRPPQAPGH
ncbi:MAG: TRAP transporter small permease [Elioraea sp.]|nr:TRAP transporter small permease [Elioraea sp.]